MNNPQILSTWIDELSKLIRRGRVLLSRTEYSPNPTDKHILQCRNYIFKVRRALAHVALNSIRNIDWRGVLGMVDQDSTFRTLNSYVNLLQDVKNQFIERRAFLFETGQNYTDVVFSDDENGDYNDEIGSEAGDVKYESEESEY